MFIGLLRAGVELEIMCPDAAPHRQRLLDAGMTVRSQELTRRFDNRGTANIRRRLVDGQFEILHAFNNRAVSKRLRAAKGTGAKIIAYRGIVGNVSAFDPASWTTYLHPRVEKIICVADAVRQYLVNMRCLWWQFPENKAVTIYKGHDLSWYKKPAVSRASLGIPEDAFVVGCTVNERPRKGLPFLIDAAASLPPTANIHFVLVGHINGAKTLEHIALSPLRDRIYLTGFRDDAPQVIASCDACILPAIKREGLPKGIIEGMAYGITPIVTNSGGSPELIENGKSGLGIAPASVGAIADAVQQLYNDQVACRAMGEAAQARIQSNFHISKTITETFSLYVDVVGKP